MPKKSTLMVAAVLIYAPIAFSLMRLLDWTGETYAVASLAACVALTIGITFTRTRTLRGRYGEPVVAALLAFFLASTFTSALAHFGNTRASPDDMWRQLAMAFMPALLVLPSMALALRRRVDRGVNLALVLVLGISIASIGIEFSGLYKLEAYGERYFGFLGDGVGWLVSFVGVTYFALRQSLLVVMCFVALGLTQSIGAGLNLALGIGVLHYFDRRASSPNIRVSTTVLVAGLVAAAVIFVDRAELYLGRVLATDVMANDRIMTTDLSMRLFYTSPVFGRGFNAQQELFPKDLIESLGITAHSTPTSTAAKVLADSGVIGIAAYLALIVATSSLALGFLRRRAITREDVVLKGLSSWLLVFLWFNHSAAWLLPGSYHSPLVFCSLGLLVGVNSRMERDLA